MHTRAQPRACTRRMRGIVARGTSRGRNSYSSTPDGVELRLFEPTMRKWQSAGSPALSADRDAGRSPETRRLSPILRPIGLIEQGLARQDRDLSLTRYRDRWEAAVFWTGKEHSVVQGTGWQAVPWAAVQQAGFRALPKAGYGTAEHDASAA